MILVVIIGAVIIYVLWKSSDNGIPIFDSYIEHNLYFKLIERGYKPKTQTRCGPYRIDITIGNIAIECDGKDFHSSPAQKKYDKKRTSYLYRHGYKSVLRFTGSEINRNVNDCVRRIEQKIYRR